MVERIERIHLDHQGRLISPRNPGFLLQGNIQIVVIWSSYDGRVPALVAKGVLRIGYSVKLLQILAEHDRS